MNWRDLGWPSEAEWKAAGSPNKSYGDYLIDDALGEEASGAGTDFKEQGYRTARGNDGKYYVVSPSGKQVAGPYQYEGQASAALAGASESNGTFTPGELPGEEVIESRGDPKSPNFEGPTSYKETQADRDKAAKALGYKQGTRASGSASGSGSGAAGGVRYKYLSDGRAYTEDPNTGQRAWAPEANLEGVSGPSLADQLLMEKARANPASVRQLKDAQGNPTGHVSVGGTAGDSHDLSADPNDPLYSKNTWAMKNYGQQYDMLTGADAVKADREYLAAYNKARGLGAMTDPEFAGGVTYDYGQESNDPDIIASRKKRAQQQAAPEAYYAQKSQPLMLNTGGEVTAGQPRFLNNDPTGTQPVDNAILRMLYEEANNPVQLPRMGNMAAQTVAPRMSLNSLMSMNKDEGKRTYYGGHWYKNVGGEWVLDDQQAVTDPSTYRQARADTGFQRADTVNNQQPNTNPVMQMIEQPVYDYTPPPPAAPPPAPIPVTPPPAPPPIQDVIAPKPPPVLMNEGGMVGAGNPVGALLGQTPTGQPSVTTPEEMAVVGLESGHIYSILGEGKDGIGGMKEPETMSVQPIPGSQPTPIDAGPMNPVQDILSRPPAGPVTAAPAPTPSSPALMRLLASSIKPTKTKVAV